MSNFFKKTETRAYRMKQNQKPQKSGIIKPEARAYRLKQNRKPKKLGMTKTEARFLKHLLDIGIKPKYEGVTFKMANGHRYTPDFVWWDETGLMFVVEVKGSYKLQTYQRARLAFDQCAEEFQEVVFEWWEEQKKGGFVKK